MCTCGMPSGHSAYAAGMYSVLLWDPRAPSSREMESRSKWRGLALAVILLPICWARIMLGDHSFEQVLAGAFIGLASAVIWVVTFAPCLTAFLTTAMRRGENTHA